MASRPMGPHSFPGLLEDTWPGMPQWSTLVLHHTCRRQTAISAGSAADQAAVRKTAKYALLPTTHVFVPIAFETLGPVNSEGAEFLSELGRRISSVSGDQRETNFSCSAFPSVCSTTMPSHSEVHFRMVVKPGTRPDFLENIFTPNIIFVFRRDH